MSCCCGEGAVKSGRSVTDICWLIIFILFCFIAVFIAAFGYIYGNPLQLVYGYDSFGNICGLQNEPMGNFSNSGLDMSDKRYLFFFNLKDIQGSLKICVKECPNRQLFSQHDLLMFAIETGSFLCRYDIPLERYTLADPLTGRQELNNNGGFGLCPNLPVNPSSSVLYRCVPKSISGLASDVVYNIHGYLNSMDTFQQVVSDLYASWKEMIILAAVACVLSALLVFFLHFFVTFVFWIIFIGVGIGGLVGTGLLWWTYADLKHTLDYTDTNQMLEDMVRNERAFLAYSIVATIFTVGLVCIMLCMRKEVPKVEMLFEEAGNCVLDIPCLYFIPVATVGALFLFFLFWISVILSLATANVPTKHEDFLEVTSPDWAKSEGRLFRFQEFTVVDYIDSSWVKYMWWYYLIVLIWIGEFILGFQQMVMAGAISMWYFAEDRENLNCPILKSTMNTLLYHIGSVAKGSFLITLLKLPRIILTFVQQKLNDSDNIAYKKCCTTCCCCCLWCLERFIKYINHNAYTVIAIDSCNFCPAAQEAFGSIARNLAVIATLNSVGDFVLFLGKCFVTAITGIIGILVMKHNPNLHFYAIPILISCIFAFFIAHCVLSLFEMILDTLTLCYCEKMDQAPPNLRNCYKGMGEPVEDGIELQVINSRNEF